MNTTKTYWIMRQSWCAVFVQLCTAVVPTRETCRSMSVSTHLCSAVSRASTLQRGGSATAHCATRTSSATFALTTRPTAIPVGWLRLLFISFLKAFRRLSRQYTNLSDQPISIQADHIMDRCRNRCGEGDMPHQ